MPKRGLESLQLEVGRASSGPDASPACDLASTLGLHLATLRRADELCGRLSDARDLHRRFDEWRAAIEGRIERAEREARVAARAGREFDAQRARARGRALSEEIEDLDALIAEAEHVLGRLGRERRALLRRFELCASMVDALPPGPERERLGALVREAYAKLTRAAGPRTPRRPRFPYTFTRGEAKQVGQAR